MSATAYPPAVENEDADPVGDGHSDADYAAATPPLPPRTPNPQPDVPAAPPQEPDASPPDPHAPASAARP